MFMILRKQIVCQIVQVKYVVLMAVVDSVHRVVYPVNIVAMKVQLVL